MSKLVFSLLFSAMGMAFVFMVIAVLTAAMLCMGFLLKKSPVRVGRGDEPSRAGAVPPGPKAEHIAVIAAALAIHRGGARSEIAMLAPGPGEWGRPALPEPARGGHRALRRIR